MKKFLFLISFTVLIMWNGFSQNQTIIAQWTFPTGVDTVDIYPDSCISQNVNYYISAEDTIAWPNTTLRKVTMSTGASTYAAAASHWDSATNAKLWSVKFKTNGATDIKVSSKLSSPTANPGPKYWKMQARLSSQDWIDIPNGTITIADDWTTGTAVELSLPTAFDNVTSSMFIRWIALTDSSISGTIVDTNGLVMIDDIIIKGTYTSDLNEQVQQETISIYPNPNTSGQLFFNTALHVKRVRIIDLQGKVMTDVRNIEGKRLDISQLLPGVYFVEIFGNQWNNSELSKLIVY